MEGKQLETYSLYEPLHTTSAHRDPKKRVHGKLALGVNTETEGHADANAVMVPGSAALHNTPLRSCASLMHADTVP